MPVSCAAYGCTNRYQAGQNIHFFRFPLANVNLNKKWIAAIKRKNFTPTKWSRLCSDHFVDENYQVKLANNKKILLKGDAVPTVFSAFPSYYQKASKVPKKEPFERNLIQIGDSNFNAAAEYDIPLGLVDDQIRTSDDIPLEGDEIRTSDDIPLEYDEVGTFDEIVLTTNNIEVQTVNTYTSELLLKKKIKILQQKLRRKEKKIYNLQELLSDSKSKGLIDGEPVNIMENSFSDMTFAAQMLNKCKQQQTEQLQQQQTEQLQQQQTEQLQKQQTEQLQQDDASLFEWPHAAILLLIEEYRKTADNFCSGRISQKKIWQSIADELVKNTYSVTGPQCQSKFGDLKRTYKSIKDHNGKSGNAPRTWLYFEIMDGLLGVNPYITPIATVSSTGKRDQPEVDNSLASDKKSSHRELPKKKSNYSSPVDKVLLSIEENRKVSEENKEKRHKEKMEQKREAINLLARLVNVLETKNQ